MIQQIIVNIFNHLMSNKKLLINIFLFSALESYKRCNTITEYLKNSELAKDNQVLSDFINYANNNFVKKRKMMEFLNNLSNQLKNDKIILKNKNEEKIPESKQQNEKNEKNGKEKEEKDVLKLSLIKDNSGNLDNSVNDMLNMETNDNNNIEISVVHQDKLEEKQKNISLIHKLIDSCNLDIEYLDNEIKNYKNVSNDLIMKSEIFDDMKIVLINKREENEKNDVPDIGRKIEYLNHLKNEFNSLKKKMEEILALYKTEKTFTEIKKIELEKLEKIKNEYIILKQKKKKKKIYIK